MKMFLCVRQISKSQLTFKLNTDITTIPCKTMCRESRVHVLNDNPYIDPHTKTKNFRHVEVDVIYQELKRVYDHQIHSRVTICKSSGEL